MIAASAASIDRFVDAIWIEQGLAANTLAAYRRDLTLLADWLGREAGRSLIEASETDLRQYALARHAGSAPTSTNRRLTVFKRFFRWAVRERIVDADPTLKLDSARQPLRVPKTLSEAQVEALLAAPDVATPLGLRDRAMLELLYASGLRVSELVSLKTVHVEPASRARCASPARARRSAWCRSARRRCAGSSATWPRRAPRSSAGAGERRAVRHRAAAGR